LSSATVTFFKQCGQSSSMAISRSFIRRS
jgi:hypothetical protein